MKTNTIFLLPFLFISLTSFGQTLKNPTFEEVISLQSVSNPEISPDGRHVAFEVSSTDWKENRFDREIWLSKNGEEPFQLTNSPEESSRVPKWSPDGQWIAFLSKRDEHTQIQVIRVAGGEPFQVTHTKGDISSFEWSPDGKQIAFLQSEDKKKEMDDRKEKYGSFAVDDGEYNLNQLWLTEFLPDRLNESLLPEQLKDTLLTKERKAVQLMEEEKFSISGFLWSPDGSKIAFDHQPDPLINSFFKSDISIYDISTKMPKVLVGNSSSDGLEDWSPDGKSILYQSSLSDSTSNYYLNGKLFRINIDGTGNKRLAEDIDEDISNLTWTQKGIYATIWQKTRRHLIRIDPIDGSSAVISTEPARFFDYSFSRDGTAMAFSGTNDEDFTEIYLGDDILSAFKKITNSTQQIDDWLYAKSEVISWQSEDGATIEGVLLKPQNYDLNKKYPLMVVIHGGPTGISVPNPTPSYVYPILQWLNKGALVLMPNYRGSAGYGEKFRSLNVKNLGVGDAWDVLSGVKYLEDKGMIDGDRVASMGWSQGGYISAFLTTNSNKFKAISVGAGISNWMTYYVNTDIHPFTRQYLKATPWSDKSIYEKTSPMTNIIKATTPTLIQHGEFDRRVPVANAYELHQGLQDNGVPSKLIIYNGFGHGITKPKERLAAMWHNWQWFGKYIWGEDIEMPKK